MAPCNKKAQSARNFTIKASRLHPTKWRAGEGRSSIAYGNFLKVWPLTVSDWTAAEVLWAHQSIGAVIKDQNHRDTPEVETLLIFSEIPEKWDLVPL